MTKDESIYTVFLKNDTLKREFQEYIKIIIRTIADESYPYMYIVIFFIVLNFVLILTILILMISKSQTKF